MTKWKSETVRGSRRKINKKFSIPNIAALKSVILKLAVVTAILLAGYSIFRFAKNQSQELKSLKFSEELQNGLEENDMSVDFEGDDVFTLLIMTEFNEHKKNCIDAVTVVRLDSYGNKATILSLHPDLRIQTYDINDAGTVGVDEETVRIKDLIVVGELQTPQMELAFPYYQMENLLALPIDGYVYVDAENWGKVSKIGGGDVSESVKNGEGGYSRWADDMNTYVKDFLESVSVFRVWSQRDVVPNIKSNMSTSDFYLFVKEFQAINEADISMLTVDSDDLVEVTDDQGDIVNWLRGSAVDDAVEGYFTDERLEREQARIEVFNGTEVSGYASWHSRWIRHIGGDVIRSGNAPGQWDKTTIFVTERQEFQVTVEKISELWEGDVEIVEGRPDFVTTGDVIVVLGGV